VYLGVSWISQSWKAFMLANIPMFGSEIETVANLGLFAGGAWEEYRI
jgi:hypothetical protein